jgi:hypothetical protein
VAGRGFIKSLKRTSTVTQQLSELGSQDENSQKSTPLVARRKIYVIKLFEAACWDAGSTIARGLL